jgi:hypothetical protein
LTGNKKLTILVEEPLTYLEMMHGGPSVSRNRKLREVQVDPITLPYGHWEQAEARHRDDKAAVRKLSREEIKWANSISWGILNGRGA